MGRGGRGKGNRGGGHGGGPQKKVTGINKIEVAGMRTFGNNNDDRNKRRGPSPPPRQVVHGRGKQNTMPAWMKVFFLYHFSFFCAKIMFLEIFLRSKKLFSNFFKIQFFNFSFFQKGSARWWRCTSFYAEAESF